MTKRAFVFSSSAAHSLSPAMHNAAFAASDLDARYEAVGLKAHELPEAVAGLRADDVYGANVTIPHKEAAFALADPDVVRAIDGREVRVAVPDSGLLLDPATTIGPVGRQQADRSRHERQQQRRRDRAQVGNVI